MHPPNSLTDAAFIQRLLLLALLLCLTLLSYQVLAFFIIPVLWSAILAYVTWPLYEWLLRILKERKTLAALVMTLGLILLIGVPVVIGGFVLQQEARNLYSQLQGQLFSGHLTAPGWLARFPGIQQQVQDFITSINANPQELIQQLRFWLQNHLSYGKHILTIVTQNLARFGFVLLTVFFFYRDGRQLIGQIRRALHRILGARTDNYMSAIGSTTQAVVYGIGLTALAQALLAGVGYWFANAPNPVLLTIMTLLVGLIPFGTPFAWGGVALWLLANGHMLPAIGLSLWGIIVVSWIDNIIRPMVISGATNIPFILIMFGVLGGLGAFGFLGIFLGPVILAVLLAVWREWLEPHSHLPTNNLVTDIETIPTQETV